MARFQLLLLFMIIQSAFAQFAEFAAGYNPNLYANNALGISEPQEVFVDIFIDDIFQITMGGTLITRIRTIDRWNDERIVAKGGKSGSRVKITEQIWEPQGRFKHMVDIEDRWKVTYVVGEGQMMRITEMTAEIGCNFSYVWFPWDWQECLLTYYDATSLARFVRYKTGVFTIHDDVKLPSWSIIDHAYDTMLTEQISGFWNTGVTAQIVFEREIAYYRDFIFIPSIFLVLVSYCSFFVDHKAIPGRVALGIIPVLTSFAQLGNIMRQLPRFSYSSWIINFLFVHTIFPIITMFEFTFCSYLEWRVNYAIEMQREFKAKADIKLTVLAGMAQQAHQVEVDPEEQRLTSGGQQKDGGCFPKCIRLCIKDLSVFKPRKIDMFFRVFYIVIYIIALIILFCIPISHEYD